jgi:hypothetical protein
LFFGRTGSILVIEDEEDGSMILLFHQFVSLWITQIVFFGFAKTGIGGFRTSGTVSMMFSPLPSISEDI